METALWRVIEGVEAHEVRSPDGRSFASAGAALQYAAKECAPGEYIVNGGADGRRPIAFRLTAQGDVMARTPDDFDALLATLPQGRSTRWLHTRSWHSSFSLN